MTLLLGEETNPGKNGAGKYPAKMTMRYSGGKAVITVNPMGEIIQASGYCQNDADARDVKLRVFKFDLIVHQHATNEYKNCVW